MNLKEELYNHCLRYVQQRKSHIEQEILMAQNSANEETKSSAGDKYETGRAMAQQEIERNLIQLNEAHKLEKILQRIDFTQNSEAAIAGSLIRTNHGVFYIAISLGVVQFDHNQYMVVSADSPIGKLLIGKRVAETIQWNKKKIFIQVIE